MSIANSYTETSAIALKDTSEWQKPFPASYHSYLNALAKIFPTCKVKALITQDDFEDVAAQQAKNALVEPSMPDSWKNLSNWGPVDGRWGRASLECVKVFLDPRNFLGIPPVFDYRNYKAIFQFADQHWPADIANATLESGVDRIIAGSFMAKDTTFSFTSNILTYSKKHNIHPYCVAAKILIEMGTSGCALSNGSLGCYNYFNVNAYESGGLSQTQNGANYAKSQGWTTKAAALDGGIAFLATKYLNRGQSTKYLERFNVKEGYIHQYATSAYAACQEGVAFAKGFTKDGEDPNLAGVTLVIPVYQGMPTTPCVNPATLKYGQPIDGATVTPDTVIPTGVFDIITQNVLSTSAVFEAAVYAPGCKVTSASFIYALASEDITKKTKVNVGLNLDTGIAPVIHLELASLIPNTDYQLQFYANIEDLEGNKTDIESDIIKFKTKQDYPKALKRVTLIQGNFTLPDDIFSVLYDTVDWGYWYNKKPSDYIRCFECYLYKNCKTYKKYYIGLDGKGEDGSTIFKDFKFTPSKALKASVGDTIQVGLRPALIVKSTNEKFVDPELVPSRSNSVCLKIKSHQIYLNSYKNN